MITFALLMYGPVPIIEIASDPKSDPEPEKQGRNKEGQPLGFGSFQVSKSLETLEVQQMDKPTAAHNPEVGGSSPPPATRNPLESPDSSGLFLFSATFSRGLFFALKFDPDFDPYGEKVRSRRAFLCLDLTAFLGRFLRFRELLSIPVPWPWPPPFAPPWSRGHRYPR